MNAYFLDIALQSRKEKTEFKHKETVTKGGGCKDSFAR
jgi:hypothetical protein